MSSLRDSLLLYLDGCSITMKSTLPSITTGAFCDIFIGEHASKGLVALKRPRISGTGCEEHQFLRFMREANIWRELSHPNILPFLGIINSGEHIWLVSPFAANGCLPEYLKAHPTASRFDLVSSLAEGIAYLHGRHVIHGDIKGTNVLVSAQGRVLVCDFGLSKMAETKTATSVKGVGNVRWQAPELLEENSTKTFATDVYAFGMTVYEILSGKVPFSNYHSAAGVAVAVLGRRERPNLEQVSDKLAEESYEVISAAAKSCWLHDPASRATMAAVVTMLQGRGTPAEGTSHPNYAPTMPRKPPNLSVKAVTTTALRHPTILARGPMDFFPMTFVWTNRPRILLVTEDPVCRILLSKILEVCGCLTHTAEDGLSALLRFEERCHDLVLMDIDIPNLDGITTRSLMRRVDETTPIIFMMNSAHLQSEVPTHYLCHETDVLLKPLDQRDLFAMLQKHLRHLKKKEWLMWQLLELSNETKCLV